MTLNKHLDDRVARSIAESMGMSIDEISERSGIDDTKGWDSFGHLRVVLGIESEFDVRFEMARIPEMRTAGLIGAELQRLGAL